MISYIKGSLEYAGDGYIIVECSGIGYRLTVSGKFMDSLPSLHTIIKVHTYMYIREDELSLYGFCSADELEVFKVLLGVNGVGPKAAISLLSALTVSELRLAVISEDTKAICRANGIGAKGASRIILELKDKLKPEDMLSAAYDAAESSSQVLPDVRANVVTALTQLGYSGLEAGRAVRAVAGADGMDEEELLSAALKKIL